MEFAYLSLWTINETEIKNFEMSLIGLEMIKKKS